MTEEWKTPLFDINLGEEEKKLLLSAFDSGWISMGPRTREFEMLWEEAYKQPSLAVSSCTSALSLALNALNISSGQEVILPSLTFVADANTVFHCGATPVFSDVGSLEYPVITSAQIESLITPKTAAIIVVHYAGFPAPVEEICELAFSRNIPVIEDCAHSPYVSYKNKLLGTFGEIGCFSFFANKNITTAEGGMLINKNHENHEKCLLLRSHGMSTLSWDKHQGHSYNYDVSVPGYNYRMDDLRSSIGIAQFKKLSVINRMREQKTKLYHEILSGNPEIIIPFYNLDLPSAYYIFPVVFKTHEMREYVAHCLKEKGIQTSLHYPPIHLFSAYKSGQRALPHTEQYGQRALTLPLFPDLNDRIIEQICDIIKVGTEKR